MFTIATCMPNILKNWLVSCFKFKQDNKLTYIMKKKLIILLIPLLWLGNFQIVRAGDIQSIASIQESVRHYIATHLSKDSEYDIQLGQIDNRLKLVLCGQPLVISPHSGVLKPGRNSMVVRRNSQKKWTIYTTAILKMYKKVIVAAQPVRRGEIMTKENIKWERKDISMIRSGYFNKSDLVLNKQATRNLMAGAVLNRTSVQEPRIIKKGDKVSIKAKLPNLMISMAGIAMMDGIKGLLIRVKNINSKQIIQAQVINTRQVSVLY